MILNSGLTRVTHKFPNLCLTKETEYTWTSRQKNTNEQFPGEPQPHAWQSIMSALSVDSMWAWTSEQKILKILTEHVKPYIWSSKTWNHALWSSKKWNHAFVRTVPKLTLINWAPHAFICIGKGSNYKHQSHHIFHNGNKTNTWSPIVPIRSCLDVIPLAVCVTAIAFTEWVKKYDWDFTITSGRE
jgi:hypothetical protein